MIHERTKLIAPCGLDCSLCEVYMSKDNPKLRENLIALGLPESAVPCPGCRNSKGVGPMMTATCATYSCAENRGHTFCSECSDFPCGKLAPARDKADTFPHNLKVINLAIIANRGVEEFLQESQAIKDNYFNGKLIIGAGPEICDH